MKLSEFTSQMNKVFDDLVSGQCLKNFKRMPDDRQMKTILKTAAVAFVAGVLTGALVGLAAPGIGLLAGVTVAAVIGIAAFSYMTSNYTPLKQTADFIDEGVTGAKRTLRNFANKVAEAME